MGRTLCTPALTHVTVEMYIILVCSVVLLFLCLFLYYHSTYTVHIFIYFLPPPSIVLCKFLHCAPCHDHDDDNGIHYKTDGHHRTIITLPGSVYCWRMQADTDHHDPDDVPAYYKPCPTNIWRREIPFIVNIIIITIIREKGR